MPSLSICIPTFNRAGLLAELLDSIVAQASPELEVIVSDDASPDNTEAVVAGFRDRLPRLTYIRQPDNIGLDRNFLAVIAQATGDYVWLIGDDDRLEQGGLEKVSRALADWPGIGGMTIGVIDYDPKFRAPTGVRRMPPTQLLFGTANVFGAIVDSLGFMSALVVNRRMWETVCREDPIATYENYYVQVYIIGRIVDRGAGWGILNTPCIGFRSSNDQFLGKFGWLKRMEIDVIAYEQIEKGLFPDNPDARRAMRHRVFRSHVLARVRNAKTVAASTPDVWPAIRLLYRHYRSDPLFWHTALPTLLTPNRLLREVRRIYKQYSPSSGSRRARRHLAATVE